MSKIDHVMNFETLHLHLCVLKLFSLEIVTTLLRLVGTRMSPSVYSTI